MRDEDIEKSLWTSEVSSRDCAGANYTNTGNDWGGGLAIADTVSRIRNAGKST